jgi:hypothetical protein
MRALVLSLQFSLAAAAAGPLSIVNTVAHQMEDGPASTIPKSFTPGETVFFSFQVENYKVSEDDKVRLLARVEAFDPKGVALQPPAETKIDTEVAPQDKEWRPKIRTQIEIPPLAMTGPFRIAVKVTDELAGTSAEKDVPLTVTGRPAPESDKLAVLNFGFYRREDEARPLGTPAYRPGDQVWVRFDIAGYRLGPKNSVDVEYGVAVLSPSGKVLFSQAQAATERSESFYPKRYLPNSFSLSVQPDTKPGEFTIVVTAKDNIGQQTVESRQAFSVE